MNDQHFALASQLIGQTYADVSQEAKKKREGLITSLLSEQRIPDKAWDDWSIRSFLNDLAMMDSNTFCNGVGVGEREGRVWGGAGGLVSQRNFGMAHGIGRSGDIAALQPKAAGSSLLSKLVQQMSRNLIIKLGIKSTQGALVLPLSTGMALTMTLLTLKSKNPSAKYVIWPRIDQKTCFKCIIAVGLIPLIVENLLEGDQVRTNLDAIRDYIGDYGVESILCIFSTSSCFAPRVPDRIVDISLLAQEKNIPHIINNAYGLQQSRCVNLIEEATRKGRVDCFIQSTDKNFLVPVGGSIIASSNPQLLRDISTCYPGRASASPLIDLFIQFLSFGMDGYLNLLEERKTLFIYMKEKLRAVAEEFGEKVLDTPTNQISLAMTLDHFEENPTQVGSMLFRHCCSGVRVVAKETKKQIGEYKFGHYGAHIDFFPHHYLNVAAAIGITKVDIDIFMKRLRDTLKQFLKKQEKKAKKAQTSQGTAGTPTL